MLIVHAKMYVKQILCVFWMLYLNLALVQRYNFTKLAGGRGAIAPSYKNALTCV